MNKLDENIVLTTENLPEPPQPQKEIKLVDVVVSDENTALNLMVSFLTLAQKRGCFTFDESAKILQCLMKFQRE
jgi:glutathione synthase/RimK-type ligase-like ATP-grasp enzyme